MLMVEKHPQAQQVLRNSIEQLQALQVSLKSGGAVSMINDFRADSFDLVFVDPPFDSNLGGFVFERLVENGCVRDGGFVYVESPASSAKTIHAPQGWSLWREQQIGEVRMQLFRRQTGDDERNLCIDGSG